jgi:Tfp pilus assembly protein PilX
MLGGDIDIALSAARSALRHAEDIVDENDLVRFVPTLSATKRRARATAAHSCTLRRDTEIAR